MSTCSVIDFETTLIDSAFPASVRDDLVSRVRRYVVTQDTRGPIQPRIEGGSIGWQGPWKLPSNTVHRSAFHNAGKRWCYGLIGMPRQMQTFARREASVNLGSEPPNADAAMPVRQVDQNRPSDRWAKPLKSQQVLRRALVRRSAAVVRALSGET